MKKKLLSLLMVFTMLVSLVPVIAAADDYEAYIRETGATGTLQDMIDAAEDGQTVVIVASTITAASPITTESSKGSSITITTDGNGDKTITGSGTGQIFRPAGKSASARRTVSVLGTQTSRIIVDGENVARGNPLLTTQYADVTMEYVTIQNANSTTTYGGYRLYGATSAGCTVTMTHCSFLNNHAKGNGGALYGNQNCTATLTDCTFTGNSSDAAGGGIYATYNSTSGSSFTVNNCTFTDNTAGTYAGAAYAASYASIAITGSTFVGNSGASVGKVLHQGADSASVTISGCTFDMVAGDAVNSRIATANNNFGVGADPGTAAKGSDSVAYNEDTALYYSSLADAIAYANSADTVTLIADTTLDEMLIIPGNLTLRTDGVADRTIYAGAAIDGFLVDIHGASSNNVTVTLEGTADSRLILNGNEQILTKSLLCSQYAATTLRYVDIVGGHASGASYPGAMHVTYGTVTADHIRVSENQNDSTGGYGGAIHVTTTGTLVMTNSEVTNNIAMNLTSSTSDGHSIVRVNGSFTAEDCFFTGNQIFINDGTVYYEDEEGVLRNNGYIISEANTNTQYTRIIKNCVFDVGERTAFDLNNGMAWVPRGNIYAPSGRVAGSTALLSTLPSLSTIDSNILGTYTTNGSAANGASGDVSEEITWRLAGGDAVTADYTAYVAALESAGYTAYATKVIGSNQYATYTKGDVTVTVIATPGSETLRVIADRGAALPATDAVAAGSLTPTVTMLGTGSETHLNAEGVYSQRFGMSFIFHLSDGKFVIVDGGYDSSDEAALLYSKLTELANGGSVDIAAWIFTHSHRDHVGVFEVFMASYANSVTLESVVFNFPGQSTYEEDTVNVTPDVTGQNPAYRNSVLRALSTYAPSAAVYKPHPGTVLQFAGAEFTFLYTYELAAPNNLWNFNDSSLVFTVEINGQTIMMTGDAAEPTSEIMLADYTAADLASDALQAAHHGWYNNIVQADLYRAMLGDTGDGVTGSKTVFWPGCDLYSMVGVDGDKYDKLPTEEAREAARTCAEKDAAAAANAYLASQDDVSITVSGDRYAHSGGSTWKILSTGLKKTVVARVGQQDYSNLNEAIAAAESGGTVTLLDNLSFDGVTLTKSLTFDASSDILISGQITVASGVSITLGNAISGGTFLLADATASLSGANYTRYVTRSNVIYYLNLDGAEAMVDDTLTPYATLAEAVAAADAGDTVVLITDTVVLPSLLTLGKAITVCTYGDRDVTIYASARDKDKFMVNITAAVALKGSANARLILDGRINGTTEQAFTRGVLGIQGANATLEYVTVQYGQTNYSSGGGGGAYCNKAGVTMSHCEFLNNKYTLGSGSYGGGALYLTGAGDVTMSNCLVDGNTSARYGGAFQVATNGHLTLNDCTVTNNTSSNVGGVIYLPQSGNTASALLTAANTVFRGNSSGTANGAVIRATGSFALTNCTFASNTGNGDINGSSNAYDRSITGCVFDKAKADAIKNESDNLTATDNVYAAGVSVTLKSDLGLNFYVTTDSADAVMSFTWGDKSVASAAFDSAAGRYTADVAAKEINQTVTATLRAGDKTLWSLEYSVADYMDSLIAGTAATAAEKQVAQAVKLYGEAAALYFGQSNATMTTAELTAALADVDVSDIAGAFDADSSVIEEGSLLFCGKSLLAKDATRLRLYLYTEAEELEVSVDGSAATVTPYTAEHYYTVDIETAPTALADGRSVEVMDSDGNALYFDISVYDYISRAIATHADNATKADLVNLCTALYQYGEAAASLPAD